jgi:hypothetical protein
MKKHSTIGILEVNTHGDFKRKSTGLEDSPKIS